MTISKNAVIIALVAGAAVAAVTLKQSRPPPTDALVTGVAVKSPAEAPATPTVAPQGQAIPRLVDLGAHKCIPCKMMAPILADLKQTYAGRMDVTFIDVWETPEEARKYGINIIPTQIFYDAAGKELFRHEGFYGKEEILAKWKELGVDLME